METVSEFMSAPTTSATLMEDQMIISNTRRSSASSSSTPRSEIYSDSDVVSTTDSSIDEPHPVSIVAHNIIDKGTHPFSVMVELRNKDIIDEPVVAFGRMSEEWSCTITTTLQHDTTTSITATSSASGKALAKKAASHEIVDQITECMSPPTCLSFSH